MDGDHVEDRNLIGTPKVQATAEMLQEIDNQVNVTYWRHMIAETDIPEITQRAQQFNLLGLFADSFDLMLQISEACHNTCPLVMVAMGPSADYAEVGFSIPHATAPPFPAMIPSKQQTSPP